MLERLSRLLLAAAVVLPSPPRAAPGDAAVQPVAAGLAEPPPATPPLATPPLAPLPPAAPSGRDPVAEPGAKPRAPAPAARRPLPPAAVLEEVAGTVSAVDRTSHKIDVSTEAGPVELWLDRNTLVYTARGLGTVLDLAPGVELRAGRNAGFVAYWIQVRTPGVTPPAPAPGTGPGGGSGAPASERGGPPGGAPGGGAGGAPGEAPGGAGTASPPPGRAPPPGAGP